MDEFKKYGLIFWSAVGGVVFAGVMTIVTGLQESRVEAEQAKEIPAVPALPGAPATPGFAPAAPSGVPAPAIPSQ